MKSQILTGQTWHCRHHPSQHAFIYRMTWLCIDLDELPALDRQLKWFGHNRASIFSISNADYAGPGDGAIREKVIGLLSREGVADSIGRIELITLPKAFGYSFNPVSFFRCYRDDGQLAALVPEVRNTFGETHHYVLKPSAEAATKNAPIRFRFPKTFYVSPFNPVDGEYELQLEQNAESLSLRIELRNNGQLVLSAGISGQIVSLNSFSTIRAAIHLPFMIASVMPRITWQALQLYLCKRAPVFEKSAPTNAATIRPARTSMFYSGREWLVRLASGGISREPSTAPFYASTKDSPL